MKTRATMFGLKSGCLARRWHEQAHLVLGVLVSAVVLSVSIEATAQPIVWDDLTLVRSTAAGLLEDNTVIIISTDAIHVDLDSVLELTDGLVPDNARTSPGHPYIPELQDVVEDALQARSYWDVIRGNSGRIRSAIVVADGRTPYRLLTDVMLTASAAGVQQFFLATMVSSFDELWSNTEISEPSALRALALHYPQANVTPPQSAANYDDELSAMFDLVAPGEPFFVGLTPDENLDTPEPDWDPELSILPDHNGPMVDELRRYEPPFSVSTLPQLVISISDGGFTFSVLGGSPIFEISGLAAPIDTRGDGAQLIDRLDFRVLYNRLVEVVDYTVWNESWPEQERQVAIVADEDIPLSVVIRTIDVARFRLEQDVFEDDESFYSSAPRESDAELFSRPCLLFPRTID